MTFDERYTREALELFDARVEVETSTDGGEWEPATVEVVAIAYSNRHRAVELAKAVGLPLSNGRHVRFVLPFNAISTAL